MFAVAGSLGEIAIPGGKNETLFDPRNILAALLLLSRLSLTPLPPGLSLSSSLSWVMVVEWVEEERWRLLLPLLKPPQVGPMFA